MHWCYVDSLRNNNEKAFLTLQDIQASWLPVDH